MEPDIHRPYYKITKGQRKRHHPDHSRPILRNDISEDGQWKERRQKDMIELLWNNLEITQISKWNPNWQRNGFYIQSIEKKREQIRNNPTKNHDLLFSSKWIDEKNEQRNQDISEKVY